MTFQEELREIVCVKFANSKGMRQNKCMSIDHILPCVYKGDCNNFCFAITTLVEKIVGEDKDKQDMTINPNYRDGFNQAKQEIRLKLEEK